jgi:exodeoxyribonuclease VII large subunit
MTSEGIRAQPAAGSPRPASTVPATAAETSPDAPWPLHLLSEKLKAHIDRAPAAWVEGQVIELNRRASMCYITLRDVDSEVSLSLSVYGSVMDRTSAPLDRGSRVVARLKPDFWVKTGTSSPGSSGCGRPWRPKDCSQRPARSSCPSFPTASGSSPAGIPTR